MFEEAKAALAALLPRVIADAPHLAEQVVGAQSLVSAALEAGAALHAGAAPGAPPAPAAPEAAGPAAATATSTAPSRIGVDGLETVIAAEIQPVFGAASAPLARTFVAGGAQAINDLFAALSARGEQPAA